MNHYQESPTLNLSLEKLPSHARLKEIDARLADAQRRIEPLRTDHGALIDAPGRLSAAEAALEVAYKRRAHVRTLVRYGDASDEELAQAQAACVAAEQSLADVHAAQEKVPELDLHELERRIRLIESEIASLVADRDQALREIRNEALKHVITTRRWPAIEALGQADAALAAILHLTRRLVDQQHLAPIVDQQLNYFGEIPRFGPLEGGEWCYPPGISAEAFHGAVAEFAPEFSKVWLT